MDDRLRPLRREDTKSEVVSFARARRKVLGCVLYIHRRDGTVQERVGA